MNNFGMAALALLIEGLMGYPQALQALIGHPVQWMGRAIAYLDEGLNDPDAEATQTRINGVVALAGLVLAVAIPAAILQTLLAKIAYGWVLNILLATTLIAQHSLQKHVSEVAGALPRSLDEARAEVGKIVGRDPAGLDESGVAKAALESLAENTSDGVVAPVFWYAVFGLPGLVVYKAVNTADSMIGHKSEKYLNFGWAAARFDDLINLPASRLTGGLFALAAGLSGKAAMLRAWIAMRRDASKHQSPNAGWPEAAMAGALDLRFGGPRQYQGEIVELATLGDGRDPQPSDINAGLEIFRHACLILMVALAALAFVL